MKLAIIRLYSGNSGKKDFYNIQEIGLAKALSKRGIYVDIIFLSNNINEKYLIEKLSSKIRLITVKSKKIFNHGIFPVNILDEFNIDIVHLLSDNQLFTPSIIKYCLKRKKKFYCYVGTIESDSKSYIKKKFMDLLCIRNLWYYKNSIVICKTDEVEKKLKIRGITNTSVIPVGLDLDIIPNINLEKDELRKRMNLFIDNKILLFVGRLEDYKMPLKFIELIRYIHEHDSQYRAIIIGNGSLEYTIKEKIKQYNLEEKILLIDKVNNKEIHKYYKLSDAFINLNDKEIFGMSILEAMYRECAVIAHSAPGPNFIINSGKNGFIINNYDNRIWFNKIKNAIDNSSIKISARKKVIEELNWDNISNRFINLFKELGGL